VGSAAGQDATEAFYGLHRHEILEKPQYQRLQIGTLKDEKSVIYGRVAGVVSDVPYAEPSWITKGYHSPYFKEVSRSWMSGVTASLTVIQSHRTLQKALRTFVDEVMFPDAQAREDDGKRPSQSVFDAMA
jgi:hypothetical protein